MFPSVDAGLIDLGFVQVSQPMTLATILTRTNPWAEKYRKEASCVPRVEDDFQLNYERALRSAISLASFSTLTMPVRVQCDVCTYRFV